MVVEDNKDVEHEMVVVAEVVKVLPKLNKCVFNIYKTRL
jgi:hypothetical protein